MENRIMNTLDLKDGRTLKIISSESLADIIELSRQHFYELTKAFNSMTKSEQEALLRYNPGPSNLISTISKGLKIADEMLDGLKNGHLVFNQCDKDTKLLTNITLPYKSKEFNFDIYNQDHDLDQLQQIIYIPDHSAESFNAEETVQYTAQDFVNLITKAVASRNAKKSDGIDNNDNLEIEGEIESDQIVELAELLWIFCENRDPHDVLLEQGLDYFINSISETDQDQISLS